MSTHNEYDENDDTQIENSNDEDKITISEAKKMAENAVKKRFKTKDKEIEELKRQLDSLNSMQQQSQQQAQQMQQQPLQDNMQQQMQQQPTPDSMQQAQQDPNQQQITLTPDKVEQLINNKLAERQTHEKLNSYKDAIVNSADEDSEFKDLLSKDNGVDLLHAFKVLDALDGAKGIPALKKILSNEKMTGSLAKINPQDTSSVLKFLLDHGITKNSIDNNVGTGDLPMAKQVVEKNGDGDPDLDSIMGRYVRNRKR